MENLNKLLDWIEGREKRDVAVAAARAELAALVEDLADWRQSAQEHEARAEKAESANTTLADGGRALVDELRALRTDYIAAMEVVRLVRAQRDELAAQLATKKP